MKAMVLAAGRGERLRPMTDRLPKPMIPVAGRPLIHYTLAYLRRSGVEEVVINLHHLGEQIQGYVEDGRRWGLRVTYSREGTLLGTGGGIQQAAPYLVGDRFVVMNADIFLDEDLGEVLRFHRENHGVVTLVLREDPEVDRFGAIEVDGYGLVRRLPGEGKAGRRRSPWRRLMFTGLHVQEPAVFRWMASWDPPFSIIEVYRAMLRGGERILGFETKGFWTDLGDPGRYARFREMIARGEVGLGPLLGGPSHDGTGGPSPGTEA